MTTVRVKTTQEEFEAASIDGYVYGDLVLLNNKKPQKKFAVYIELGTEGIYEESRLDDPKTEYKILRNCSVYLSETYEMLENGKFLNKLENATVIIYY